MTVLAPAIVDDVRAAPIPSLAGIQGLPARLTLKRYASFLGLSNTTSSLGPLPINLGPEFNNTSLLVDPVVLVSLDPFAWLEIPIPPSPALIGAHVYAQGIGYGMLGALFSGWGLTAGVDLQLGWL